MIIDLHAHHINPAMLDLDPHWGPRFEQDDSGQPRLTVGDWVLTLGTKEMAEEARKRGVATNPVDNMVAPKRLEQMDARGIDRQVISLPAHMYMYHTGPDFGLRFCQATTDSFAEYCAQSPERLYFWAPVPLQTPEVAAKELERAVGLGAKGLSCGGRNFGGYEFDSEELYPVWRACVDLDVPLFVHAYNESVCWGPERGEDRYDSTSIVGFCYDETMCFWNLICGGVLDEFPDLKVYITHGGGFVPYQLGRLEQCNGNLSDGRNKKPLREYLRNFYFDPLIHEPVMRRAVIELIDDDRLLYGDNFNGSDQIRGYLLEGMDLPQDLVDKICGENARKLLKI